MGRRRTSRVAPCAPRPPRDLATLLDPNAPDIPDLASYDVIELSSSAGKDSVAAMTRVRAALDARGLMARATVVHADLGRVEWEGARELAEEQALALGFRFMVVRREQEDLLAQVRRLRKWPMPRQRFCTADSKRGPILVALTQLADEAREHLSIQYKPGKRGPKAFKRPVRVLNCVGLRAAESPGRAKRPRLVRDKKASGQGTRKIVDVWLPVHDLNEEEVWALHDHSGVRRHPAYAAGLPRASCILCIFAPEAALMRAGRANRAVLREYVALEQEIGHKFRLHLPLAQIEARIEAGEREPEGPIASWSM